jgi:hypothetical protein
VGGRGPAGGHYFSTPSAERVRDVLSPEAEPFPDRGVCWGLDLRGGRLLGCMWVKNLNSLNSPGFNNARKVL